MDAPWWNDERVGILTRMLADGYSHGVIARRLGAKSRSAVIGKARRLGLSSPADKPRIHLPYWHSRRPVKAKPPPKPAPPRPPRPPVATTPKPAAPDKATVGLQQLEAHHCRWPVGDPRLPGFGFCGAEPKPGKPYCDKHEGRAYDPRYVRR
jgi:GcrA cell cycle regulator